MNTIHDLSEIPTFEDEREEDRWWEEHTLANDLLNRMLAVPESNGHWLGLAVLGALLFCLLSLVTLVGMGLGWL